MRELSLTELKTVTGGAPASKEAKKENTESAMPNVQCLKRKRGACAA